MPLSWRLTRNEAERGFPARMLEILDRHHGQVTGMFTGMSVLPERTRSRGPNCAP